MSNPKVRSLKLGNEGQLTLSSGACERLGAGHGVSVLEIVTGNCVLLIPENPVLSEAMQGAREALARAGVTVDEVQEEIERIRAERFAKEFPDLAS